MFHSPLPCTPQSMGCFARLCLACQQASDEHNYASLLVFSNALKRLAIEYRQCLEQLFPATDEGTPLLAQRQAVNLKDFLVERTQHVYAHLASINSRHIRLSTTRKTPLAEAAPTDLIAVLDYLFSVVLTHCRQNIKLQLTMHHQKAKIAIGITEHACVEVIQEKLDWCRYMHGISLRFSRSRKGQRVFFSLPLVYPTD